MAKIGQAKIFSEAEFLKVLEVVNTSRSRSRDLALIIFSFGLGLRAKELASLTVGDVADDSYNPRDKIYIKSHTEVYRRQGRYMYTSNPKVYGALAEHLKSIAGIGFDKPLFQSHLRQAFSPCSLQKWFSKTYQRAGITGASSQSGRRTYITKLIEKGIDLRTVSKLAGHSSVTTTALYAEDVTHNLKLISSMALF